MLISSLRRAPSRTAPMGGTTFALLAPARCALRAICDVLPSHFPVLRLAWPIFQPPSGVELAFRYSDGFYTESRLGVALRLPCLIFWSCETMTLPLARGALPRGFPI